MKKQSVQQKRENTKRARQGQNRWRTPRKSINERLAESLRSSEQRAQEWAAEKVEA